MPGFDAADDTTVSTSVRGKAVRNNRDPILDEDDQRKADDDEVMDEIGFTR